MDFTNVTTQVGEGIAGFLNPLFGSSETTTTTTQTGGSTPAAQSSKTTTTIIVAVVALVLVSIGAFIILKKP